ncbi:hypothetical protein [Tenacibaculum sp. nBUS_03]|uniref:hypothetical protein n=1 Tax=Tenacibaculum sp. nBUS_03 TaxID=3395320 RepID=UPI003EBEFF00
MNKKQVLYLAIVISLVAGMGTTIGTNLSLANKKKCKTGKIKKRKIINRKFSWSNGRQKFEEELNNYAK